MWTLVQYGTRRHPYRPSPTPTTERATHSPRQRQGRRRNHRNRQRANRPPVTPDWRRLNEDHIIQVPPCKRPTLSHLGYADSKYPMRNVTTSLRNSGTPCKRPAQSASTVTTPSGKQHCCSSTLHVALCDHNVWLACYYPLGHVQCMIDVFSARFFPHFSYWIFHVLRKHFSLIFFKSVSGSFKISGKLEKYVF